MNPSNEKTYGEEIQKMIRELAKGNFSYRITRFSEDELGDIAVMINLLAEELNVFFIQPNLFGEKNYSEAFVFVLDSHYMLCGVNRGFTLLTQRPAQALIGKSIREFLDSNSYKNLQEQLVQFPPIDTSVPLIKLLLTFVIGPSQRIHSWGYSHSLMGPNGTYYFIRGGRLAGRSESVENFPFPTTGFKTRHSILQFRSDIEKIRAVHQYILAHLHEPLPSLATLSRLFFVNEYKLKRGFKELFHTTIFKFHLEKRLEHAFVLIRNTPTSLKVIAFSMGFKSFPHFSKVFKDKYGCAPSFYRKG